jgi:methionyl-tRNA synthetase
MAKSTGNVVNPFFAIDRFGIDVMRYYLAYDGGIQDDSDYGNHNIVEKYKKGLQGGLGNLVSRITRPKVWNVREAVQAGSRTTDQETVDQVKMLTELPGKVQAKMDQLNPRVALHTIMDVVFEVRSSSPQMLLSPSWTFRASCFDK